MYAVHLASGHTLFCRQIKLGTIKKYILHVATWLARFCERDWRKDSPMNKDMCPLLNGVYTELERYEKQPNRREPFTVAMLQRALEKASPLRNSHPTGLACAMADWSVVGLNTGSRKVEWSQDVGHYNPYSPKLNVYEDPYAFLPRDITAMTSQGRKEGYALLSVQLPGILKVKCTHRTQKNGQNGEERMYTPDKDPNKPSFVKAIYSIMQRHFQLFGTDSNAENIPLAAYSPGVGKPPRLITATETQTFMRQLACEVYHLDPVKDRAALLRWSSHSFRVGACVLLDSMGFSATQIQWILRWRSMAFMAYLRNTVSLSNQQHEAFASALRQDLESEGFNATRQAPVLLTAAMRTEGQMPTNVIPW